MQGRLVLDLALGTLTLLALAIIHNARARHWYAGLGKGRMRRRRIAITVVNLILLAMALLMIASGLMNSYDLFPFLRMQAEILGRRVHAWAAYWFLVLASLHIGLHWTMIVSETGRLLPVRIGARVREYAQRAAMGYALRTAAAALVGSSNRQKA